jgi:hypothetical protein
MQWHEKRRRIRLDIAAAFSARSGIGEEDFFGIFYDAVPPPPIGDFDSQYLADEETLEEILAALSASIGLDVASIERHYDREESFPQFAEHLLRAGAYR